jgi:hypothetical protein
VLFVVEKAEGVGLSQYRKITFWYIPHTHLLCEEKIGFETSSHESFVKTKNPLGEGRARNSSLTFAYSELESLRGYYAEYTATTSPQKSQPLRRRGDMYEEETKMNV